ncbi:MAG: glutathione S-transferase N-terminal domain-containing protein [Alphaproteobacteria bacterium]|nr:glutathione S-transferase N-terminal domain-containing protein [Alphaproteobacteria bacterium]
MARAAASSAGKRKSRSTAAAKPPRPTKSHEGTGAALTLKAAGKKKQAEPKKTGAAAKAAAAKGVAVKADLGKGTATAARERGAKLKSTKPIEVYYWPTPNGWKVSIMLEECGLPYVLKPVNIERGEQDDADFLKLSPNGRIPAILDPAGPGGKALAIFESGAILQYLGRKSGRFYPKDERLRCETEQWLFWQMSSLGPMAGQAQHFRNFAPEKIAYAVERYTHEVHRLYSVMARRLQDRDFLAGPFTIADIACVGWIMRHQMQGQSLEEFPALKAWHARMLARPGVQRGLAVGADLRGVNLDARGRL